MSKTQDRDSALVAPAIAFFCVILTLVSGIAWYEALDFDPCDNVIKHAGADCLEPGLGGVVVGGFVMFMGLAIASGALRRGRAVYGRWLEPLLFVWFGLAATAIGAAAAYAQWSLGLS